MSDRDENAGKTQPPAPEREPPLRHKSDGRGTHGEPPKRPITESDRPLPEGNGATGEPAAYPEHP